MIKENLVLRHLLGDKTKGGYVSQERAVVKSGNGPHQKASDIETEAEGEKIQATRLPGAPSPCQGCLPQNRASAHHPRGITSSTDTYDPS